MGEDNTDLEMIADSRTSFWEYAKVFLAVEGGAFIGGQIGVRVPSDLSGIITGATLAGDYIGGTIGQLASYWYNNREKFRGEDGGLHKLRLAKDFLKIMAYDAPVTAVSYGLMSPMTYAMTEAGCSRTATAAITSVAVIGLWNTLNYFVYSAVKKDSDEKFLGRAFTHISCIFRRTGE